MSQAVYVEPPGSVDALEVIADILPENLAHPVLKVVYRLSVFVLLEECTLVSSREKVIGYILVDFLQ